MALTPVLGVDTTRPVDHVQLARAVGREFSRRRKFADVGQAMLFLIGFGAIVVIMVGYAGLAIRARRRGLGHSFMGPFEDMWDPAQRRSETAIHEQVERGARAQAPGDDER